jgi:DNA-binding LacI/PurR family transcriptional regulator
MQKLLKTLSTKGKNISSGSDWKERKKTNHMQQKALDRTREAAVSYSRKRFHYLQGVKKKKGSENIVRLKDVAEACGVSVATVSRALNGLSDENKEKTFFICQTARDMGYYPNAAARTLKTSRSNNIGILYEDRMNHEYFSSLIDALRKCAEERGYDLTFIRRSEETTRDSYYEHAQRRNLDGVIVLQADFDSAGVIRLATSNIPTVIVDHVYEGCDCVSSDNRASMEQIVHRVREAGHQRVALIQGQRGAVSQERLAGFYKGCAENGIRVPVNYVVESRFHDPDSCALEIKKLLALPEKPTCILCPDDYSCLGALWMLREEGICVPENVSLIGYDGIRMARLMHPRPTTYCQDYEAIAREVVKLILEGIEEPDTHVRRQITVPGKLLEGDTLGAPAAD